MERVFRRTPTSEKAAIYGYKDLLKDSLALLKRKAGANVKRMTSGGMSEGELLEMATAPAGGMLKSFVPGQRVFKEETNTISAAIRERLEDAY